MKCIVVLYNTGNPILSDSWNYMPPILVSSSIKWIAAQILPIAKLNGKKKKNWEALFVISSVPARKYLFKVNNWSTRIRCENCLILRMKTLEPCPWCHSNVFIVNCERISNFVLISDVEKGNFYCVNIEKINTFEDKIRHLMRSVVAF